MHKEPAAVSTHATKKKRSRTHQYPAATDTPCGYKYRAAINTVRLCKYRAAIHVLHLQSILRL